MIENNERASSSPVLPERMAFAVSPSALNAAMEETLDVALNYR